MTTERLQKFLSRAGVASRRTAEEIIKAGRVAVNGQVVTAMGVKVDPGRDVVQVDGSIVKVTAALRTVMLHKPYGYVCTTSDPEGRRVVTELLGKQAGRLYPVGRLDYDATGLLLLTNDGELAYRLTHPSYQVPRTYRVTVDGRDEQGKSAATFRRGGPGWPVRLPRGAGEQAGGGKNRVGNHRARGPVPSDQAPDGQGRAPGGEIKAHRLRPPQVGGTPPGHLPGGHRAGDGGLEGRGGPEVSPEERPLPAEMVPEPFQEAGFVPPWPAPKPPRPLLHLGLLLATVATTVIAGAIQQGVNPLETPGLLYRGIPFSFTLLLILGSHEMGHYLVSRRHHLDVTLPYFIPAPPIPFIIGTFGAFIRIRSPIQDKRALMDVGCAGPLTGVLVSIPVILIGLKLSAVSVMGGGGDNLTLGEPLLFKLLSWVALGWMTPEQNVILHPVAFAGWIGLLVTALNLIPVGQLDGGHVAYALFPEYHRYISLGMLGLLVVCGVVFWQGWLFWAGLIAFLGWRHPPPYHFWVPLDRRRRVLGIITIAVFVLTFTPTPFVLG